MTLVDNDGILHLEGHPLVTAHSIYTKVEMHDLSKEEVVDQHEELTMEDVEEALQHYTRFANLPIDWESEQSVFDSDNNIEWKELSMNERSSQGTRVCKEILREVLGADEVDENVMYVYILKLEFSSIRIVPEYKKSIFEGYLLFTSDYLTDEHKKNRVINNIYSQYNELESKVESETFEDQIKDEGAFINRD